MRLKNMFESERNGVWGHDPRGDGTDVVCVRVADFDRTTLRIAEDRLTWRSIPAEQFERSALRKGDILVEKSGGGDRQPVGVAVLFDREFPAVCSNFIARLRPREGVNPRYATYVLASRYQGSGTVPFIKQTTGIQNLDSEAFLTQPWLIPDPEAQTKTASFLDRETTRIDMVAAAKARSMELLLERKQSVYGLAVVDDWPRAALKRIAELGTGHTPSRSHPEYWVDCTIPWMSLADVWQIRDDGVGMVSETAERISPLGLANSAAVLHPAGTVMLSRTASVGFSAIMGVDMATTQDFFTWTCSDRIRPEYLLYVLRASRGDLGRLTMGSTHKTIYMPDIEALTTPLPPLAEQDRIVEAIRSQVSTIDALTDKLDRQLTLLAEHREALITAAVTGQIDVTREAPPPPEAALEPA